MTTDTTNERVLAYLIASLAITPLLALISHMAPAALFRIREFFLTRKVLHGFCVMVFVVFAALLLTNAAYPGFLDQAEVNIATTAWLTLHEHPMYHAIDSANRYSLLYGPMTYLPFSAALFLFGNHVLSLKLAVIFLNLLSLLCLWKIGRQKHDALGAMVFSALVVVFLFLPRPNHYLLQSRADVVIIFAVCCALYGAIIESRFRSLVLVAVGTALMIDAKASACIYAAPVLALQLNRQDLRTVLLTTLVAVTLSLTPFAIENVSLRNYLEWLASAKGHLIAPSDLKSTLLTLPLLLSPFVFFVSPDTRRDSEVVWWVRQNALVLVALSTGLALSVLASARIGAGSHYLLPFVPILGYLLADLRTKVRSPALFKQLPRLASCLAICIGIAIATRTGGGVIEFSRTWHNWDLAEEIDSEMQYALSKYGAGAVGMGYGDELTYTTYFRPKLIFSGQPLVIDDVALSDMKMDGIGLPESTFDAIAKCSVKIWLVPIDQEPFLVPSLFYNNYPSMVDRTPLFGHDFSQFFQKHYEKIASTSHFDFWECRARATDD